MRTLSKKQLSILNILCRANPDGSFCDMDQLLKRLDHKPSKESLQFSIRSLTKRGLIEKKDRELRRGQSRRVLAPTILGYSEHRNAKASGK